MKKVLLLFLGLIVTICFMACVNKDDEEDEKSSSEFSVVFDANGGTMSNADKNSTSQKTYVVKPNAPVFAYARHAFQRIGRAVA